MQQSMWEKIKRLMTSQNLTMYALSKKAGINQSILVNLKAGRARDLSFQNACKIADALGASLDDLR